jgi:hypothetical protein
MLINGSYQGMTSVVPHSCPDIDLRALRARLPQGSGSPQLRRAGASFNDVVLAARLKPCPSTRLVCFQLTGTGV